MEIIVDKRIELMAVIQTIEHYWDNLAIKYYNQELFKCKYKKIVDNYFKKYKSHETVKLFSILCNDVQDISTFINLVLCYSSLPNLNNIANLENNINCLTQQKISYENFVNLIKRFYNDTNFEYFFENNQSEYKMLINDYISENDLIRYENVVEAYLKSNTVNYTIVVSALIMGCFGIRILTNENVMYNYSIISPFDFSENRYIFGSKFSVLETLWHEISHLTINNMTKSYINQLDISHKKITNSFVKNFYTDIETIINEYIVRAITIRLFEINYGDKKVGNLIQENIQKGFTEIESIKNYISKNCEKDNKFTREEGYIKLLDYVINKI